jgi:hypothetical protein
MRSVGLNGAVAVPRLNSAVQRKSASTGSLVTFSES